MAIANAVMTKTRKKARRFWPGLMLVLCLFFASSVAADWQLEQHRTLQTLDREGEPLFSQDLDEVVLLGSHTARYDTGFETFIVRSDDGVFLWLDHKARTYAETSLSPKLEDLLTVSEKECLQSFPQALADAEASVKLTDEQKSIGEWRTKKLHVEGQLGDVLKFTDDRWITHELRADLAPYLTLVRAKASLSTKTRGWVEQLLAVGGFPVESRTVLSFATGQRISIHRLLSVREVEPDGTRYYPPADYTRVARPRLDVACRGRESAPPGFAPPPARTSNRK